MALIEYDIVRLAELLSKRELSSFETVKAFLDTIHECRDKYNAFLEICETRALSRAREIDNRRMNGEEMPALSGIPIAINDNICTKDIKTTCASRMLINYVPEYNATVINRLYDNGMIILGKTNLDEFSLGATGEHSAFGGTKNPHDLTRVAGGASSGSAAAVAAHMSPIALGSDAGGSIRIPAAHCGIIGFKPSYGAISRFGLVATAPSFEQIGIMSKNVRDARLLSEVIYHDDPLDATSAKRDWSGLRNNRNTSVSELSFGYFEESLSKLSAEVRAAFYGVLKKLERYGADVVKIKADLIEYHAPVYYVISCVECASSLARYDGIKYGLSPEYVDDVDDLVTESRTVGFGDEVKLRILFGNYALSAGYYEKACKARRLVTDEIRRIFDTVNFIISPVTNSVAPELDMGKNTYNPGPYCVAANLAGLPAISIPAGRDKDNMPIGVQLLAERFEDVKLLNVADAINEMSDKDAI